MDIRRRDLRIEVVRPLTGGVETVRVTHIPSGVTAYADDAETIPAKEELALDRLGQALLERHNLGPTCSFCGQRRGRDVIAGPYVFICFDCVRRCVEIVGSSPTLGPESRDL